MEIHNLSKEEFKSFPSGHTSVCALTMFGVVLLPFIMGKELKHQVVYFYCALAYTVFVAFTRLLVGAHYLSDVGMGGLITLICLYIFYEIILHNPKLYEEEKLEAVAQ
jgi:membrane-associated phospholipid phosphatase